MLPAHTPSPAVGPQLIQDTPIIAAIEAMAADLERLRQLAPNSDARTALEVHFQRLNDALRDARERDVWLSTEKVADMRGTTPQAVTYLCRKGRLVARKRGTAWEVHRDSVLKDTRRSA